jgi:SAM-dependent methyltransferase
VHQANAAFWNEIADTYSHGPGEAENAIAFFRAGGNSLLEDERRLLGDLSGGGCRRAIHLQCSGGNDALSLLAQGADEVVGVDISRELLSAARMKTEALGARATWVLSDVISTPEELNGTADLVYTGKGALCWMSDIAAWATVVARLLAPGGRLFVYESHPLDWVWDTETSGYVLDPVHGDYFSDQPRRQLFSRETQAAPQYRQWTLADIINAVIGAGLTLERLEEFPVPFWDQFSEIPPDTLRRLPHAFALLARK